MEICLIPDLKDTTYHRLIGSNMNETSDSGIPDRPNEEAFQQPVYADDSDSFYDLPDGLGAADPYVNLTESENMNFEKHSMNQHTSSSQANPSPAVKSTPPATPPTQTNEAIQSALQHLQGCQTELAESGLDVPANQPIDVEVIEASTQAVSPDAIESKFDVLEEQLEHVARSDFSQVESEVSIDEIGASISENWTPESGPGSEPIVDKPGAAVPVFGLGIPGNDPVFDVRDFVDVSNRSPEPISGAYQTDPYCYDFNTAAEVSSVEAGDLDTDNPIPGETLLDPVQKDQLFIANAGDVIQIDGDDGFDHIDLACYDASDARVSEDRIIIDDENGTSFVIRFRNIDYALFGGGVKVDLQ